MRRNSSTIACLGVLCLLSALLLMVSTANSQHQQETQVLSSHASMPFRSDVTGDFVFVYDRKLKAYVHKTTATTTTTTTRKPLFTKRTTTVRPSPSTITTTTNAPVPSTTPETRVLIDVPSLRRACEEQGNLFDADGNCREVWRRLPTVVANGNGEGNQSVPVDGVVEEPVNITSGSEENERPAQNGSEAINERPGNQGGGDEFRRPVLHILSDRISGIGKDVTRPVQEHTLTVANRSCPHGQEIDSHGLCRSQHHR